jgi:hypothetical protein
MFIWFDKCALLVITCQNVIVSLRTAASALCPSCMTYIPLFYVVTPNISNYVNMLIHPLGMIPSIYVAIYYIVMQMQE